MMRIFRNSAKDSDGKKFREGDEVLATIRSPRKDLNNVEVRVRVKSIVPEVDAVTVVDSRALPYRPPGY